MKSKRLNDIVDIILSNDIDTQETLLKYLKERGYNVTQATVSRDINALSLVKIPTDRGSKYALPKKSEALLRDTKELFDELIVSSMISVDHALNTVCIKCKSGMAQAVCARIDMAQPVNTVGTLAGEDTIFVLMRTENDAAILTAELNSLYKEKMGNV
ncbi:hypothetical protein [Ruminococcus sp. NK3A76]|uniref:arginine repressor n=1 Tax=Ruminococcus sp. NK3A76 TaxID=877411 RepID=UPI00055EC835|nr:hypothetical protein [Ruminococcus sp. NK3A76]